MLNVVSLGLYNEQLYSYCLNVALLSSYSHKHVFIFFLREVSNVKKFNFFIIIFQRQNLCSVKLEALAVIISALCHTCRVIWVLAVW